MLEANHYVPILKGKDGEYGALKKLDSNTRKSITPLVEVMPMPSNRSNNDFLVGVANKILNAWGSDKKIFVDLRWLDSTVIVNGLHPLEFLFNEFRLRNIQTIPVTGINRDLPYQTAVKNSYQKDKRGICFRLEPVDFDVSVISSKITSVIKQLGANVTEVDLILDLQTVVIGQAPLLLPTVETIIRSLPNLTSWRTFTISATSFPSNLSPFPSQQISKHERTEWLLWSLLYNKRNQLQRLPSFGDYAVAHPDLPPLGDFPFNMSAQIRYTVADNWLIVKGYGVRTPGRGGHSQTVQLSKMLIKHPEYCGPTFSWGDQYINDCAHGIVGVGNATTWRHVGNSHHITFVVDQISNLIWP